MKKHIVVINGTGGCGKTSFAEFCSKYANVQNVSSVAKVKEIARIVGWDGGKNEKDRKFLSDLKKITTEYNDMSFNEMKVRVEEFLKSPAEILFLHIREPEEIKRAVSAFGAKTLLIKKEGLKNITSNSSDADVDNYDYDYIIINTSLENLEKEAEKFVQELK